MTDDEATGAIRNANERQDRSPLKAPADAQGSKMMKTAASQFSSAAKVMIASPDYCVETGELLLPVCTVLAHSIECHLKAFLCLRGFSLATLEGREYGHDLGALAAAAYKCGMPIFTQLDELLKLLSDGASRRTKFKFRYPKISDNYTTLHRHELLTAISYLEDGFREAETRTPVVAN